MALSPTILASLLKSKLLADGDSAAVDNPALEALCKAVAEACVEHIIAAAVVTVAPGITIAGTGGGPAPVVGATTAPGVGTVA